MAATEMIGHAAVIEEVTTTATRLPRWHLWAAGLGAVIVIYMILRR